MSYAPHRTDLLTPDSNLTSHPKPVTNVTSSRLSARISNQTRFSKKVDPRIPTNYPIIVHCHLCWDWVWQRPQQFLSRLSQRHPILFVEMIGPDPQLVTPVARFQTVDGFPNITRLQMQFPSWRWGNAQYVDETRRKLLEETLSWPLAGKFKDAVQWFYDPMAVDSFAGQMGEIATVYDCMDELSKFRHADPELVKRESRLLAKADVVFTGGRKLYDSKSQHNDNCHFYGCGVDCDHFGKARSPQTEIPQDLKAFNGKKVLGYFGVVDERMDYELIAKLADADPDWQIVIVGPHAKVEEHTLPRRPNLHWVGGRPYSELPAYCKGFDVCLMPFAMNEATEFINPTKALEYMATGTEIVSSAVPDVIRNFGTVVKVAQSHDEFVSLCRKAAAEQDRGAIERGLKMAANNSWDSIVAQMEGHITDVLARKQTAAA